jgi:uncharacterized protein YndB with AHSA1/START domain
MDEPHIVKTHGLFGNTCRVDVTIRATPERVWQILTDTGGYPRWNTRIDSVEGDIREGGRVKFHLRGTDRVFTSKVSDVVPNERMSWVGGAAPVFRDVRNFTLTRRPDGTTDFSMEERFSGLMVSLLEGADLTPIFERYANELKREAETSSFWRADPRASAREAASERPEPIARRA